MKAVVIEKQGGIENLNYRDWPDPTYGDRDVLIAVKAVSLNHLDIFVRRGMPGFPIRTPFISGGDVSGRIVACGKSVVGWKSGERVAVNPKVPNGMMGEEVQGGMAEFVAVPASHLVRIPASMDYVTAACIPINFGTALRMLVTVGHLQRGELVLIVGASGGVGTACIQLCRNMGACVIAVTRGADKAKALTEIGADYVIDSIVDDFSSEAWRISDKKGVDLVINYTGGSTWVPCLKAMRRRGRMVTCGATESYHPETDIRFIWVRELQILGSTGYTQQDIESAFNIVASGQAKPIISSVLDISNAREAHRVLEGRRVIGKVVLTVPEQGNPTEYCSLNDLPRISAQGE